MIWKAIVVFFCLLLAGGTVHAQTTTSILPPGPGLDFLKTVESVGIHLEAYPLVGGCSGITLGDIISITWYGNDNKTLCVWTNDSTLECTHVVEWGNCKQTEKAELVFNESGNMIAQVNGFYNWGLSPSALPEAECLKDEWIFKAVNVPLSQNADTFLFFRLTGESALDHIEELSRTRELEDGTTIHCSEFDLKAIDFNYFVPCGINLRFPAAPSTTTTTSESTTTTSSPPSTTTSSVESSSTSSSTTSTAASTTTTTAPVGKCITIGNLSLCASDASNITKKENSYTLYGPGVNINGVLWFEGNVLFSADEEGSSTGRLSTRQGMFVALGIGRETIFKNGGSFEVDGDNNELIPLRTAETFDTKIAGLTLYGSNKPIVVTDTSVEIEPMVYIGTPDFALAKFSLTFELENGGSKNLIGAEIINGRLTPSIQFMTANAEYDPDEDILEMSGQISFPFLGTWGIGGGFRMRAGCFDAFEGSLSLSDDFAVPILSTGLTLNGASVKVENICRPSDYRIFIGADIAAANIPSELLVLSKMGLGYEAPRTLLISSGTVQALGYDLAGISGKINIPGSDKTSAFILIKGSTGEAIADVFNARLNLLLASKPGRVVVTGLADGTLTIPDYSCATSQCKIGKALLKKLVKLPYTLQDINMNMYFTGDRVKGFTGGMSGVFSISRLNFGVFIDKHATGWDLTIQPNMSDLTQSARHSMVKRFNGKSPSVEQTVNLTENLEQVIFAVIGTTALPDIYLKPPRGTIITPTSKRVGVSYYEDRENYVAMFVVNNAAAGTWTIGQNNLPDGSVEFRILGPHPQPTVQFTSVISNNNQTEIQATVIPPNANTKVSFFYTTSPDNATGDLIVENLSPTDGVVTYTWDTSNLTDGTYFLFARIDDGVSPPVITYSSNPITINKSGLLPPTNITAKMKGDTAHVEWTPSVSRGVIGYNVLYDDRLNVPGYAHIKSATRINGTEITGLDPLKTYRLCVVGYDNEGNMTPESSEILVSACPVVSLLSGREADVNVVRSFRDTVLNATPEGRELVEEYYRHAAEITTILQSQPELQQQAKTVLVRMLPVLATAKAGKPIICPQELKRDILELVKAFHQYAGEDLRKSIARIRSHYFGIIDDTQ